VELWGREPHVPEVYDYNRLRLVRTLCQRRRLQIAALGSYVRFAPTRKNADHADLLETLQIAHTLRTSVVRVWASDVPSEQADEDLWRQVVAEAQQAAQRSQRLGLTLVVEMHDHTLADTAASALRLVQAVGYDNFRLNYQPSAFEGSEDPLRRLDKVLPWVAHCHAQNFARLGRPEGPGPQRAPLRAGLVDYARLVARLRAARYRGWIALEFAYQEGDGKAQALAEDLAYLCSLLRSP
jgi:3-dehydroshikimate dehydratase